MSIVRNYYQKKGPPPPNFFIGGVSSVINTVALITYELQNDYTPLSLFKVKNFKINGSDISFNLPSPLPQQGQIKWQGSNVRNLIKYYYDVGGNVISFEQGVMAQANNLERIILPKVKNIHSGGGYKTLENTKVKGFVEFPELIGEHSMNYVFNNAKITHLKYPKLKSLLLQDSTFRVGHSNISTLKRVYMPLCDNIYSHYSIDVNDLIISYRNFNLIPNNTVMYLNPILSTNRNAETFIRTINVEDGDSVTINGLTYTATTGNTTGTHFKFIPSGITDNNITTSDNLAKSVNMDNRIGTFGKVTAYHQYRDEHVRFHQTISGSSGNVTTYSVSDPIKFPSPSGSTFNYGGTEDTAVLYWRSRGCDIRYVTDFTSPNPPTSLNALNWTSNSVDLTFTPPTGHIRPIDFYEVWIDDGIYTGSTIWQKYLPHQEISGSGITVTDLEANTPYTIRVKAADTFYNVSEFSMTVSGSTI